ncbi:MAG: hypothetical protein RLZZ511_3177 [Cyanobacteriota bacterium]|jgi:hypothetical protein
MTVRNLQQMDAFVARWEKAGGKERANYQMFFAELCDALGVERPNPQGGELAYEFDYSLTIYTPGGKKTSGYIDFYKENHFVIEAKQGSEQSGKGTAKRGTQAYLKAMEGAFNQAVAYARNVEHKPPFVLTCDIGSHFELWMGFSGDYGGYGARREITLADLRKPDVFALFVDIFTNPQARNPEKIAAIVTREVAADLAKLAKSLEVDGEPQAVAQFLMRCIFTMFAEDVGLLKEQLFTETLRDRWLKDPKSFKPGAEGLWRAMNEGNDFGFYGKLLRFNGGLFANSMAFDLTAAQLEILLAAAKRDWRNVEPAIFGTLLERALDSKERSKLGAHYTPRSYVERLVRPVVMEPLRDRWEIVQAEVNAALKTLAGDEPTKAQVTKAKGLLERFLTELRGVKVLDPACGSGNFLYVTLDLIKQLESEVFRRLADVTGAAQLRLDIEQVNPSQFLGIELNARAATIADLVIWIGYLQWHFRRFGDVPPLEPVLREYRNIECRDAVLAWDRTEPDVDRDGKVRTRWGGRMVKSPVTGEDVPDATDQVTILKYINPRQAEWPEANYIVSNPPFIGNYRIREMLGDGYAEMLRKVYKNVPDTVDFVMYWWQKGAALVQDNKVNRFGFITTNTITQKWQRKLIDLYLNHKSPIQISFAIPDHPWVDEGAAVRIAMTVGEIASKADTPSVLGKVIAENSIPEDNTNNLDITWIRSGKIFSNLEVGTDSTKIIPLKSNQNLCGRGVQLFGMGFCITEEEMRNLEPNVVYRYLNGRDLLQTSRNSWVIDLFGLTEKEVANKYPAAYQWILDRVKPERDQNNRKAYRDNWWIFGEPRANLRPALKNINRYIATAETAKYRVFQFLDADIIPDNRIVVMGIEDSYFLGVLSSKIHTTYSLKVGGTLEDRPVYSKTTCFDPFPFPDPTEPQKQKIRDLGERLDAHRKRIQAAHPEVTITAMYNLLEKLRKSEPLDDKDKAFNQKALVSTLKQIHDELDAAVFDAYSWPSDSTDEQILENLVTLNAQRAEEERNGHIRWLRPDYQNPNATPQPQTSQGELAGIIPTETPIPTSATQQKWPKDFKDQIAAIRDLLRTQGGEWNVDAIAAQFKNATRSKAKIQDAIDALETLGLVTQHTENHKTTWYFTDHQKTA